MIPAEGLKRSLYRGGVHRKNATHPTLNAKHFSDQTVTSNPCTDIVIAGCSKTCGWYVFLTESLDNWK